MLDHWVPFDVLRELVKDRIPEGFSDGAAMHIDTIPKQLEGNYFEFESKVESESDKPGKIEIRNKTLVFAALMRGDGDPVVGEDGVPELHLEIAGFAARRIGGAWYFSERDDDIDLVRAELEDKPLDVLRQHKAEEEERIRHQAEEMKKLRENFKYPG